MSDIFWSKNCSEVKAEKENFLFRLYLFMCELCIEHVKCYHMPNVLHIADFAIFRHKVYMNMIKICSFKQTYPTLRLVYFDSIYQLILLTVPTNFDLKPESTFLTNFDLKHFSKNNFFSNTKCSNQLNYLCSSL